MVGQGLGPGPIDRSHVGIGQGPLDLLHGQLGESLTLGGFRASQQVARLAALLQGMIVGLAEAIQIVLLDGSEVVVAGHGLAEEIGRCLVIVLAEAVDGIVQGSLGSGQPGRSLANPKVLAGPCPFLPGRGCDVPRWLVSAPRSR